VLLHSLCVSTAKTPHEEGKGMGRDGGKPQKESDGKLGLKNKKGGEAPTPWLCLIILNFLKREQENARSLPPSSSFIRSFFVFCPKSCS